MIRTIQFTVTGKQKIHCAGCELRIDTVLRRVSGVRDVQASAGTQRLVVKINPAQVSREQVQEKLAELGYEVTAGGLSP